MPIDVSMFDDMIGPLLKFYDDADARLSQIMGRAGTTDFAYRRSQLLLEQINSIVLALQEKQRGWALRNLPRSYRMGMDLTAKEFRMPVLPAMTLMDYRSIEVAVARMMVETANALQSIAPFAQKVWTDTQQTIITNQQIAGEVAAGRVEGLAPRELGRRLKQSFIDGATKRLEGHVPDTLRADIEATANGEYIGIICKDGKFRRYNMRSYSELVANNSTRQVATEGAISATLGVDGDLIQISVHSGACENICAGVQRNVYSLSGRTIGFPILTDDARPPLHPNCRHVLLGADADFLQERGVYEKLQEFSSGDAIVSSTADYEAMLKKREAVYA
jgi:hypothetical protein